MALFKDLNIEEPILKSIEKMGFTEATPIQSEVIPVAKNGRDVIGQAQTGTGKTVAFGIPLLESVMPDQRHPQGLVLAPTRELAIQVSEELNKLGQGKGITSLAIYGGQEISKQIRGLKKRPQIIVGTPGRFMDHMRRKTIRPEYMNTVVLDEADEMLSMGFIEDIETILKEVPEDRRTMLFSATMPKRLKNVVTTFMTDPVTVAIKSKEMTVENIEQRYVVVHEKQKFDALCHMLDIDPPELAIVFGRTKRRVDEVAESLGIRGFAAEGLHGDMKQERRDAVIRKFKRGAIDILVATDVAARGLDVNNVSHVYNFDLPQDSESYVHRIGRTGRAGKSGIAFSFVTPKERDHLKVIEKNTKKKMKQQSMPTYEEALAGRQDRSVNHLQESLRKGDFEHLMGAARAMLAEHDPETLVAAALKTMTKEPDQTPVSLTGESPVRSKRRNSGGQGGQGGPKGQKSYNRNSSARKRSDRDRRGRGGGGGKPDAKVKSLAFKKKK
ncbi:DEAD/DEAH box helicase [Salipaludibacillus sp. CUR1]|uniref:DEAD/DEAH box helicase n=1 Tax=Salipaludibacillus sp. CUR1 TaxID=2820003 RepID=UPI00272C49D1|nr:DEAD/DEAH box helicase [Salipaludibacillus sp. CUR1]